MSELHCPARFLICSNPSGPEATVALARERVALTAVPPVDVPTDLPATATITDQRLTDAATVGSVIDELADRYRGECVVIALAPATLAGLDRMLLRSATDRDITVVS